MTQPLRILVVEDSEDDTLLLLRELRHGAFEPAFERVETPAAMAAALARQPWDVVVADFSMPKFNALAALELLKSKGLDIPFIIVSGTIGEELAVAAMRNGAKDYIMKGNLTRLVPAVTRELREASERRARQQAEEQLRHTQEQFRVAHEIQQRLFPKEPPQFPPFDIAGASHPAEAAGGDYFDYVHMGDGTLGIVVADVAGHGVGPALLMAEARAYLRTLAINGNDVGDILTSANQVLAQDTDLERYVTLILTKLNPKQPSLVHASAGHPTCYVLDGLGNTKSLLRRTGIPLGVPPKAPYAAAPPVSLSSGDIVLLLTDGIEETQSPDNGLFGVERTLEVVRACSRGTAQEILDGLYGAVRQFSRNEPQHDDLTAVVVKVG